ncbi:Transmembrane protein 186 like protein [Argiope bruennichi]|uniref:Transmembrane protein 186 n=1 Tax=Argiope bruennichi TaxID=94029 RepID=A0A8T0EKT4_ARGBR|nr:Transmembrane protein 186 like protein [Argiope bruennichi]
MFIITRLTVLTNFKIASNLLLKHKQIAKLNYVSCAAKSRLFQENKKSHDQNPWTPIYFFPYIRLLQRLIGVIFLSEDEKSVQISHLTFWGRKKDIIVPSQEIVPLADSACNPNDVYIKLKSTVVKMNYILPLNMVRF